MTPHNTAAPGDIAETVLLAGDPLRARFVATQMLTDAVCYNEVRNMLGYTGYWNGHRVSVQGTGIGMPSLTVYVHELLAVYKCRTLIRIGTCGALLDELPLRSLLLAMGACTDSSLNRQAFGGMDFAPIADFGLLRAAAGAADRLNMPVRVGNVFSSDVFYPAYPDPEAWTPWRHHGVMAVEMESAALYTLAARHGARALSILMVTDYVSKHEALSPIERQEGVGDLVSLALHAAFPQP